MKSPGAHEKAESFAGKELRVLWTILSMCLILWLLGFLNGYSMGGVIHVLPIIAIIAMLVQVEADCSDFGPGRARLRRLKRRAVNRSGRILPKLAMLSGEKILQPIISPQTYREEQPL
jgi:hypothetical protein